MKMPYKGGLSNEMLKEMLKDRDTVFEQMETEDIDDAQLTLLEWYKRLPQLYKDLIFLRTKYSVIEIADVYGVSRQLIYHIMKKIDDSRPR